MKNVMNKLELAILLYFKKLIKVNLYFVIQKHYKKLKKIHVN